MTNSKIVYAMLLGMVVLAMALVTYVRTISPNHAVALDAAGIAKQLNGMNDMVSVRDSVQRVIGRPEAPESGAPPMYTVMAQVTATIDLRKITAADVTLQEGLVTLRMPAPEVVGVVLDEAQTRVWDPAINMWTTHSGLDTVFEAKVREKAIEDCRQGAIQSGIPNEASTRAHTAIRRMLSAAGMKEVHFAEAPPATGR